MLFSSPSNVISGFALATSHVQTRCNYHNQDLVIRFYASSGLAKRHFLFTESLAFGLKQYLSDCTETLT